MSGIDPTDEMTKCQKCQNDERGYVQQMRSPRYQVEIPISEGRQFMKLYFGNRATIPHGSKVVWMAGVRYITDQPGLYLIGGVGGLQGIQVLQPASENLEQAS